MIKDIFEYLKVLFKKWYLYLGILPTLYSRVNFNFGIELPNFIGNNIEYFSLLLFFLASFNAWKELKDKLKNPVDYEITYKIEEINYGLDENIQKAKDEIIELENKIEEMKNKENNSTKLEMKVYEVFGSMKRLLPDEKEKLENKISELNYYIKELEDIKKLYLDWKKLIFLIKNTGNIYDENINIKVVNFKGVVLQEEDLEFELRNIPEYPEEDEGLYGSMVRLNNAQILYNSEKNKIPYREKIGNLHFELKDLHINDEAEIFYVGDGIIIGKGDLEFDFEIKSKNTREVIEKKIFIKNN